MRRLVKALAGSGYFLLCFAQIPLIAGHYLLDDCLPALIMLAALLPVSFGLSLLPGKIGGKRKDEASMTVVRSTHGGDPDPDRALRNEALPLPEKKAFPLRAFVCMFFCLGVVAGVFFMPIESVAAAWWPKRLVLGAIMAVMLPLALKMVALDEGGSATLIAGIVLYLIAGLINFFAKDPVLNQWLLWCGLAFIVCSAFASNNQSMTSGATVRTGVRPPASMRTRNRILLAGLGIVGAVILYFDQIRATVTSAAGKAFRWLWNAIVWLLNHLAPPTETSGGAGGSGDMGDMLSGLGSGESGAFWKFTEKIAIVLSIVLLLVILFFLFKKIGKTIGKLLRQLMDYLKKLTAAVSEDYQDEQESLFDWGETRREMGDELKKRLARLTKREKKWDQMDARERVRYIVRAIYRRTPDGAQFRSLTVHEALPMSRTGQVQAGELADLYDQARYAQSEPDPVQIDRLRKEAKV